ncbi:MAG: HAMP domain-containing histidine kinase [Armatimonadetes bacterium]|nr:HAMP domain-containing histidine kinase [Armatimonadota bacterium]MDW8122396.1 HAMP domain-containing sensor histidine kinase [Armatimonadota bacterium]
MEDLAVLELRSRLCYWLVQLRWLAVVGTLATVLTASYLGVQVPLIPLTIVILLIGVYNLFFAFTARPERLTIFPSPQACAAIQMVLDLFFLALLLHFSGGIENPFSFYFVFHMVIGSVLLPAKAAFALTAFTVVLFGLVVIGEWTGLLQHYHLHPMPLLCQSSLFVFSTYFALVATLVIVTFMTSFIAWRLRKREYEVQELAARLQERTQQLSQAYEKISQAEAFKSHQMRKMSHELRAPLNAAMSILSLLKSSELAYQTDTHRHLLVRLTARLKEMQDTVNDMLVLAQIREAKEATDRTPVSLSALVTESLEKFQPMLQEKKLSLETQMDSHIPNLLGSETALSQMVDNLISNAIRYTKPGGRIGVSLRKENQTIILQVWDSGVGIPAEDLPHIFEEFYRGRNARQMTHEGTGLGLSIVKAAAEGHGGSVEVDSELGVGTTFTIKLPLAAS